MAMEAKAMQKDEAASCGGTIRDDLARRILILDGAMGTMLQRMNLEESDFRGERFADHAIPLKGNNEALNLTRPDAVAAVHRAYLEAGADIVETNSFNAISFSQKEYGLDGMARELACAAAKIARREADRFSTAERRRHVAGSIGPTGKTLSMSPKAEDPGFRDVTFDEMEAAYRETIAGLLDGGVDLILLETIFDTLNAKAAIAALHREFDARGRGVPVMISGTLSDASGRLLAGQNAEAFLISVLHAPNLLSVGFNCALGAAEMRPHLADLAEQCPVFVSAHPNAGLPDESGRYRQDPETMAGLIREFAASGLINIVGGCCGTTPEHIRAIARAVEGIAPRKPASPRPALRLAGLDPLVGSEAIPFFNVGERTNVAGSRKFLNLIKAGNIADGLRIARGQVENGACVVDVNMDDPMLDAQARMREFLLNLAGEPEVARAPLMIDSSNWDVMIAGLKCAQGKSIVNSISLKEGEEAFLEHAREAKILGAAVLCMAFDEEGQADTVKRRVAVCRRMHDLLTERAGFSPDDIIFDVNVFAIATGIPEHDSYAADFIEAVRILKREFPRCHFSGGISNVSFSFRGNDAIRGALHSVFLYHAVRAGLDMGIVNPAQLALYDDLDPNLRAAAEAVILNSHPGAAEELLAVGTGLKAAPSDANGTPAWRSEPLERRIAHALIHGDDRCLAEDMAEALERYGSGVAVVEGPLMDAMKEVGVRFGEGKMFLPQVVRTARVMKKAVDILIPPAEDGSQERATNGTVVIATVKGDVHDIGKNIAAVVLRCNGFRVIDLGVMTPCETIMEAVERERADAVALSGLITPSLAEMRRAAEEMQARGWTIPLLIGGAATSKLHTATKIQPCYDGPVVRVPDASCDVPVLTALLNPKTRPAFVRELDAEYEALRRAAGEARASFLSLAEARARRFRPETPYAPFPAPKDSRIHEIRIEDAEEILPWIHWNDLFLMWRIAAGSDCPDDIRTRLREDAGKMIRRLFECKEYRPKAVMRVLPAHADGDDAILPDGLRLPMLRAVAPPPQNKPCYCAADFLAPEGIADWLGFIALTAGLGTEALAQEFERNDDVYSRILLGTTCNLIAEALAEKAHFELRTNLWGYSGEACDPAACIAGRYVGFRCGPGYPSMPDHSVKREILPLLEAERRLGTGLTESCMMIPESSVCCVCFGRPEARPGTVGRLSDEAFEDYAARRGLDKALLEKLIAPPIGS